MSIQVFSLVECQQCSRDVSSVISSAMSHGKCQIHPQERRNHIGAIWFKASPAHIFQVATKSWNGYNNSRLPLKPIRVHQSWWGRGANQSNGAGLSAEDNGTRESYGIRARCDHDKGNTKNPANFRSQHFARVTPHLMCGHCLSSGSGWLGIGPWPSWSKVSLFLSHYTL